MLSKIAAKAGMVLASAATGALLFILLRENAASITAASLLGFPAPVAGVALAFPCVYMLWEQSET